MPQSLNNKLSLGSKLKKKSLVSRKAIKYSFRYNNPQTQNLNYKDSFLIALDKTHTYTEITNKNQTPKTTKTHQQTTGEKSESVKPLSLYLFIYESKSFEK